MLLLALHNQVLRLVWLGAKLFGAMNDRAFTPMHLQH